MIEKIRRPLCILSQNIYQATGIKLDYSTDKRVSSKFNPEEPKDMLSMYPYSLVVGLSKEQLDSQWQTSELAKNIFIGNEDNITHMSDIPKIEIKCENEDGEAEDYDLEYEFANEMTKFYANNYPLRRLVLCIDEMYLKTISDKLEIGALEDKDLDEKVLRDLTPYVLKYIQSLPNVVPKIKEIVKNISAQDTISTFFKDTYLLPDFTKITRPRSSESNMYNGSIPWTSDELYINVRKAMISLILAELMSDIAKGRTDILKKLESTIPFVLRTTMCQSRTKKFLDVEMIIKGMFSSSFRGSMFDRLLSNLMEKVRDRVDEVGNSLDNTIEIFITRETDYSDISEKKVNSAMLSSKLLLKYAENLDIMIACSDIAKSEIRLYAEGFFASDEDLEKEMNQVIDMSRRAAICKIDMEYITTKYSKKDAINNAYICLQDIRDCRKKLKCKEAIEKLDLIEDILLKDIRAAQSFDHKKSRMTINIAYPTGYEG